MDNGERGAALDSRILPLQIIAGALVGGILLFAAVTLLVGAWNAPVQGGVLKYLGLILPVFGLVPFVVVPSAINSGNFQRNTSSENATVDDEIGVLLGIYQVRMIVRFSLVEGAAFLNLIAFMVEHARWSLGVAGLLVLVMLAMFPTRTRVEHWLEAEQTKSVTGL